MTFDPEQVPRPVTEADYAECYRANVVEARGKVEWCSARWRQFKAAGQITARVEGGWKFEGPTAAQVHGDLVRWQSDLAHWTLRLAEAEASKPTPDPDRRLPREPGEDDDERIPF